MDNKPPLPPYTSETAAQKVRMAEDAWNTRDPDRVVLVYTEDTPTANLYVSMLNAFGAPVERFADSTGPLPGVLA